jgi:hypothetical protein
MAVGELPGRAANTGESGAEKNEAGVAPETADARGLPGLPKRLDKLLIINQAHLRHVMRACVTFFNTARPHQGLDQQIPTPQPSQDTSGPVRCRNVLGGIIHDYYRDAA